MDNQQNNQHYENPEEESGFEDIAQAQQDITTLPAVVVVGQRPDGTPIVASFDIIAGQEECEGSTWVFPLGTKVNNLRSTDIVSWEVSQQALDGGPLLRNLRISSNGSISAVIPGAEGDQAVSGADEIMQDYNYKITVAVNLSSGRGGLKTDFNLLVKAAPDGQDTTLLLEEGKLTILFNANTIFTNNPTRFTVTEQARVVRALKAEHSSTNPRGYEIVPDPSKLPQAPNLTVLVDNVTGNFTITPSPIPDINARYEYELTLRGQNDCGWDDVTVSLYVTERLVSFSQFQLGKNIFEDTTPTTGGMSTLEFGPITGEIKGGSFVADIDTKDFYEFDRKGGPALTNPVDAILLGVDPDNYTPVVSISNTGKLTLHNVPLVKGPSQNPQYPIANVVIPIIAVNTAGVNQALGNFAVFAVQPEWSSRSFSIRVNENTQGRFTFNKRVEITNYAYSHSMSDPVVFSLVNSPSWTSINANTGTVTIDAPIVTGSPMTVPSQVFSATIRAKNGVNAVADKALSIIVVNTMDDPEIPGVQVVAPRDPFDRDDPEDEGDTGENCIPSQTVEEEENFSVNVRSYMPTDWLAEYSGNYSFSLTQITAENTDAPIMIIGRHININSVSGTISGTAPQVNDRHELYSITVTVTLTLTDMEGNQSTHTWDCTFGLTVTQKSPEWQTINIDPVNEFDEINFSVLGFCDNDPTEFDIGNGRSLRTPGPGEPDPPPPPKLKIDNSGNVTAEDPAPDVETVETYSYPITARNTINYPSVAEREANKQEDFDNLALTIQEVIPKWKSPISNQEVDEGEEITISLLPFVDNDPDTFSLVSKTAITTDAKPLDLTIDRNTGLLSGMAHLVDEDTSYRIIVSCENSAGQASPNGTFILVIKNLKPEWSSTESFEMPESSTKAFNVFQYITQKTRDVESPPTMTFSVGSARLTSSHNPNPTMTTAILPPNTSGIFRSTVSAVAGENDAYFTVPVTATNSAGSTSQNFTIRVLNETDAPTFTLCSDQSFPEQKTRTFRIAASHELVITYSRVSGPSWVTINSSTGTVTVRTPEVTGTISANPWDDFNATFRAAVTNTDGDTFTTDCSVRIRVINTDVPDPGTAVSWDDIPGRMELERDSFSFSVEQYVNGSEPFTIGERPDVDNPDYITISTTGQIRGTTPDVGSKISIATRDGRIWQLTLTSGASLGVGDFTFNSGVLDDDNELEEVKQGGTNTLYFLRFTEPVTSLQIGDFSISGADAGRLARQWYNTHTIYVTVVNFVSGLPRSANTSFPLYLVNTDTGVTEDVPPTLNVPDQTIPELTNGSPTQWSLDLNRYTSGTHPFTYERTQIGNTNRRYSLPDWETGGGTGVNLTPMGIISGTVPTITEDETHVVFVTARNHVGFDPDIFRINITDDPATEYEEPEWSIKNKTYPESRPQDTPPVTTAIRIAPLETGELTGSPTPTITLTNPTASPLPSYLTLSNNVLSGNAPANLSSDQVDTILLTATNTNPDGENIAVNTTFTITITDESGPHRNPSWHISNISEPEGTTLTIDPIANNELRGSAPLTITLTDAVNDPLPFGLTLENNVISGVLPQVMADDTETIKLTGTNTDDNGVDHTATTEFMVTVENVAQPYKEPEWSIKDSSWNETEEILIDPIKDGLLTGTMPIIISLTDGMNFPLPSFLTLTNNILSGTAPNVESNTPHTIKLRATNTNPNTNTTVSKDTEFVLTINNEIVPDPQCEPPRFLGIRKRFIRTGESGVIDIRNSVVGGTPEVPPQVEDDPDFSTLPFITSPNHGTGLLRYSVPEDRDDYEDMLGSHTQYLIASACGQTAKTEFTIAVIQAFMNPPKFGTCPPISMNMSTGYDDVTQAYDNPSTYSDNMYQYLTSTHNIERPTFSKAPSDGEDPWQSEDWWSITEAGTLNITAKSVPRTETQNLKIRATNPDGYDDCEFSLTINYVPQPPKWREIGIIEVNERANIDFALNEFIRFHFTNLRIDSVVKVRSAAPELFIKPLEPPSPLVGRIQGTNNADQSAVGTSPILSAGSSFTVNTRSAPDVSQNEDYTVTITVVNTGLPTTPEFPTNSDQTTFTLRIVDVEPGVPEPSWVQIPLQTTESEESISMSVGQYARGSPTSFEIISTTFVSGFNAGPIILTTNNAGVVTRQGGAVAPTVSQTAKYNVVIRASNSGGHSDCPFEWWIIPKPPEVEGAPAFYIGSPIQGGYFFGEWNPETGTAVNSVTLSTGGVDYGFNPYIEGVSSNLYMLGENKQFGTISYNGVTATSTNLGLITPSTINEFRGLTSVGSVLYSFGRIGTTWKLYSIDTVTRRATAVNTGSNANNFGLSNPQPGGLTAISQTVYAVIRTGSGRGTARFVSIPVSGSSSTRGLATTINTNISSTVTGDFSSQLGMETFGSIIQARLSLSQGGFAIPNSNTIFNINRTSGVVSPISTSSIRSMTQYAISKPVCTTIPTQLVQEGQPISFPMAAYFTGETSFTLGPITSSTSGAPPLPLQINNAGIITGTTGNVNAPDVVSDSYYTMFVYGVNSAGRTPCLLTIGVLNAPPVWTAVPEQFVDEGNPISIGLLPYVRNQPTYFSLGAITKPNDDAPTLELQVNSTGNLFGVGSTVNAPSVDQNERYTVVVNAENAAGSRSTTVAITVRDIGDPSLRVPYVRTWDVPNEAQDDAFDVLIDFNIPVYDLRPASFQLDGIELRGQPFLLWAPVPTDDIPANRPTADQRNLDYLTTPVPTSGTKYFKLSFPRNILPEVIERDELMNIYLVAHEAQGGITS